MDELESLLEQLVVEHDEHMVETYSQLASGAESSELAIKWAYGAGLQYTIRRLQVLINN